MYSESFKSALYRIAAGEGSDEKSRDKTTRFNTVSLRMASSVESAIGRGGVIN